MYRFLKWFTCRKPDKPKTMKVVDIGVGPDPIRDYLVLRHRFQWEELFSGGRDVFRTLFPDVPMRRKRSPGEEWFEKCAKAALESRERLASTRKWVEKIRKEKVNQGERV